MRKFKLEEQVACINTNFGIVEDHKIELKESDFPNGRAGELVKSGHLVEVLEKPKKEAKKTTKK